MTQKDELKARVKAKRKELEAHLHELEADGRSAANDGAQRVREKLDELSHLLRDGWDDMSESAAAKLNDWLR